MQQLQVCTPQDDVKALRKQGMVSLAPRGGSMRVRVIMLAVLCSTLLGLGVHPATAQERPEAWSPPERLDDGTMLSWFPDIAADPGGNLHAVWNSADQDFDITMYSASREGLNWSTPVDIVAQALGPNGESYVTRPVLNAAVDGTILLSHHGQGDDSFLFTSTWDMAGSPKGWDDGELIATAYHSIPVLDAQGVTHLATTDFASSLRCARCLALNYRRREPGDSTWSAPVYVGQDSSQGAAKPTLLVDGDNLYMTWEAGQDGDRGYVTGRVSVMFSRSTDGGRSWSRPLSLDSPAQPPGAPEPVAEAGSGVRLARNVTLGLDGSGTLVAVWWRESENLVDYRYSPDGGVSWSDAQTLPGVYGVGTRSTTSQDRYVITRDGAGQLHLLMVGSRIVAVPRLELLHLAWDGRGWSAPALITSSETDLLEWPAATVRQGNELHVVWHTRPGWLVSTDEPAPFQVWHSMRMLDAPSLAAVALPTSPPPTPPRPTATLVPPTATPEPTLAPAAILAQETPAEADALLVLPRNIRSENDEVLLITLALLPVLLIVGSVIALGVRRSRKRG